jgi:hypothetical protein
VHYCAISSLPVFAICAEKGQKKAGQFGVKIREKHRKNGRRKKKREKEEGNRRKKAGKKHVGFTIL